MPDAASNGFLVLIHLILIVSQNVDTLFVPTLQLKEKRHNWAYDDQTKGAVPAL